MSSQPHIPRRVILAGRGAGGALACAMLVPLAVLLWVATGEMGSDVAVSLGVVVAVLLVGALAAWRPTRVRAVITCLIDGLLGALLIVAATSVQGSDSWVRVPVVWSMVIGAVGALLGAIAVRGLVWVADAADG